MAKLRSRTGLEVADARQQDACIAGQPPARLEQSVSDRPAEKRADHRRVFGQIDRDFVAVANADSASQVDVLEVDAFAGECVDELQHLRRRLAIRLERGDLRADMDVDAAQGDAG